MVDNTKELEETLKNIEQETRMVNYVRLSSARTWSQALDTAITITDRVNFAYALADMPETFREEMIEALPHWMNEAMKDILTKTQTNMNYDPGLIFPIVATPETLASLISSARRCYLCNTPFAEYQKIIWKYCWKHTMHYHCLRDKLIANELPLHGPCGCVPPAITITDLEVQDDGEK